MRWFLIAVLAGSAATSGCGRVANQSWQPPPRQTSAVAEADENGLLPIQIDGDEPEFNTEAYDRIYENPFLLARDNPLSTFSIDVDTASYSNVRRFLERGGLPPPDAVRIEELINYFPYDYEPPTDEMPFAAHAEVASCPWNPEHRLVRIGLKGKEIAEEERGEANLVFLLDVSGSMDQPNKLPLLKSALGLLVQNLSDRDRVAIVVYAGAAGVVLPPTSCEERPAILAAMDRLKAGGSTAGSEGIQLAYQVARENFNAEGVNRVILCTDGDFNVGVPNQGDLTRLIEQKAAEGVFLTCLGFGMGNYKDSTLERLANKGNGNYAYIDTIHEARKVLVEQLAGTLVTIAKDVKIQVDFNPSRVGAYRLIGYENRLLRAEDFRDDTKDAGEIGAGHSVTAFYELIPVGKEPRLPQAEPSKYQQTGQPTAAAASDELLTVRLRYKQPAAEISAEASFPVSDSGKSLDGASGDFQFAAAVACFGMLLRNSEHRGQSTYDLVLELARFGKGDDPHGYRAEFLRLVEVAKSIQGRRR
jgi:Ca-activated chloride channel homolog